MIVVAGRPRTGTSMLMRMLAAADVPVLIDQRHDGPQAVNPHGFFEHTMAIGAPALALAEHVGQHVAVKLFWRQLGDLLDAGIYPEHLLCTARPAGEAAASWALAFPLAQPIDEDLMVGHETRARALLAEHGVPHLTVAFHDAHDYPHLTAARIAEHCGIATGLDGPAAGALIAAMADTIDPTLRRHGHPTP